MTVTPFFVEPDKDTLKRQVTINFTGGSLTASYALLRTLFVESSIPGVCTPIEKEITRKQHNRFLKIGGSATTVSGVTYTLQQYPSSTTGQALGGEIIFFRVEGDWWTARLSGNHSDLMKYLCDNASSLARTILWKSARGTKYGPVTQESDDED